MLLCEFTFGQIPGFPKFVGTRNFPTVYTVSYTLLGDASSADVTAQVINTGSIINETGSPTPTTLVSGLLWGNSPPFITDGVSRKTTDGRIDGQPFITTISQLPEEGVIYIVAYATTAVKTYYGKVLTISQDVVRSPYTNKLWMDRNVGATSLPQSATVPSSQDSTSMGGLYQWGRNSDGHQIVLPRSGTVTPFTFYSGTNATRQSDWAVVSDKFYTKSSDNFADWLLTSRNTLWQGLKGENNPCPTGFRVPTVTEFTNETNNFPQNMNGAFTSFLRLPATGYRDSDGKPGSYVGYNLGRYWTSSVNGTTGANYLLFTNVGILSSNTSNGRILGHAVRCIKGEATSGGSAVISGLSEGSSTGSLYIDQPASGVTKTMYANVTTAGSYKITTSIISNNGVVLSASGTFTSTGNNQPITFTATGTPIDQNAQGQWTYYTNTDPQFALNLPILREPSTNGVSIVSGYTSISSQGELFTSEASATQTIRANVTKIGTYYLSTITNNGINFVANGTFTTLGNNDITLVATGAAISAGTYTFTINTTPGISFNRVVYLSQHPSTNSKAIVSGYTSISSSGAIYNTIPVSEVTQTIRANVTKTGDYNISTNTINGIKFAGTDYFYVTGDYDVLLTATGTPTSAGNYTFTTNTNPSVSFTREFGQKSSGGQAVVSGYTNGQSIIAGTPTPGIKQTITANVTTPGTYNITTNSILGSRFVGSGTFTSTGNNQSVILTLTPTPTSYNGVYSFTLKTTPTVSFNITNNLSSGGSSLITWSGVSQSGLTTEQIAENNRVIVRQTEASTYSPPFMHYIVVNVTQIGTYNIETFGNRTPEGNTLRLVGSGTFTTTGVQTIPLYYYGSAINYNGNPVVGHYFYFPSEANPQTGYVKNSQ